MEHNIMDAKALMMDVINRKEHPELYKGFKTGYKYIDNLTGGFYPGQLVTISSYEFGIKCIPYCILNNMLLKSNIPCALFSYEEGFDEIGMQLLHYASGIDYGKIRMNFLSDEMNKKINDSVLNISSCRFIAEECHLMDFESLCNAIRRQCNLQDLKVIFIHTLNALPVDKEIGTRKERFGTIVQKLKRLALELNVCIILPYYIEDNEKEKSLEKKTSFLRILSDVNLMLVPDSVERSSVNTKYELTISINGGIIAGSIDLFLNRQSNEFVEIS